MKNFLSLRKALSLLAIISIFISCSDDDSAQQDELLLDEETQIDNDADLKGYTFFYNNEEVGGIDQMSTEEKDLLDRAHWVINEDNTIQLFDSEAQVQEFNEKLLNSKVSYNILRVTLYLGAYGTGQSVTLHGWRGNFPSHFDNKAKSYKTYVKSTADLRPPSKIRFYAGRDFKRLAQTARTLGFNNTPRAINGYSSSYQFGY